MGQKGARKSTGAVSDSFYELEEEADVSPYLSPLTSQKKRDKDKAIPGFVHKLFNMVNESASNLIEWNEKGDAFQSK